MTKIIQIVNHGHTDNPSQFDNIYLYDNGEVWHYYSYSHNGKRDEQWTQLSVEPQRTTV